MARATDFVVASNGDGFLIAPVSEAARKYLADEFPPYASYTYLGPSLLVRDACDVVQMIREDGLKVV